MTKQENRKILITQMREVIRTNTVTCTRGLKLEIIKAYKCLYCGIWFCRRCAKEHFEHGI